MSTSAPRCKENVAVFYNIGGVSHGNALNGTWLRLHFSNVGLMKATGCLAYFTRITRNGVVLDTDSSPLEWTDEEGEQLFGPKVLVWGDLGRKYVNLCGCDEFNRSLHLASRKARKGYHSFAESGLYTFDITISVDQITRSKKVRINVLYDADRWGDIQFI